MYKMYSMFYEPSYTIDSLREEASKLQGDNLQKYEVIPEVSFNSYKIEIESLFLEEITGNESSSLSKLIKELSNFDWIKKGMKYLPASIDQEVEKCPFCQEKTISKEIFEEIKNLFDENYERKVKLIESYLINYSNSISNLKEEEFFLSHPIVQEL